MSLKIDTFHEINIFLNFCKPLSEKKRKEKYNNYLWEYIRKSPAVQQKNRHGKYN